MVSPIRVIFWGYSDPHTIGEPMNKIAKSAASAVLLVVTTICFVVVFAVVGLFQLIMTLFM